MLYLSKSYDFYIPSDNVGVVAFSLKSNDLFHIPNIPSDAFEQIATKGFDDATQLTLLLGLSDEESVRLVADLTNKGIFVQNTQ